MIYFVEVKLNVMLQSLVIVMPGRYQHLDEEPLAETRPRQDRAMSVGREKHFENLLLL